ncbi:MAG: hypothetical protein HQK76_03855 [Desulfobacterales bacterium]|nr:hypothetical protein [Desulfobacterales bacterium]
MKKFIFSCMTIFILILGFITITGTSSDNDAYEDGIWVRVSNNLVINGVKYEIRPLTLHAGYIQGEKYVLRSFPYMVLLHGEFTDWLNMAKNNQSSTKNDNVYLDFIYRVSGSTDAWSEEIEEKLEEISGITLYKGDKYTVYIE